MPGGTDTPTSSASMTRALDVVRDRWTFLILLAVFRGTRRFGELVGELGIARNLLSDRLVRLVEHDVLEKVPYCERPLRFEYRLTPKGADLSRALAALTRWGDRWMVDGDPPTRLVHDDCGTELELELRCPSCDTNVSPFSRPRTARMTTIHHAASSGLALLDLGLDELMARARVVRDEAHGRRVTYSPKVFIPLTMLCRDRCGYCTFAKPPARLDSPYLTTDEVLEIAVRGAELGCHEALFTLGEAPEERYPAAQEWLDAHGFTSTVDYLAHCAQLVLDETGLLPHANAGALDHADLSTLRRVAPSQGMMIETLAEVDAHRGAPDKTAERRLATLEAAGELAVPFTTGILVGIGETRTDRVEALEAIAASHARHGHVQEVIVQNFLPKPGTAMHTAEPCPEDDFLEAIALARLILPPEIHLQAPPNLSDDFGVLLDAGIDDWGGVSPVTADHVNPERPWPALDRLAEVTEAKGFALAPRLTVYPEHVAEPGRWFDEALRFPVMDRSDTEGLGRDDPGALFPEKTMELAKVADGAEVEVIGRPSTAWYSGAPVEPVTLVPGGRAAASGPVGEVLDGVRAGEEVGVDEIVTLLSARGPEVRAVAAVADELRSTIVGDDVTWVANRNINYTNVCTFKCKFCGFSKGPLSLNLRGTPYLLTLDDIAERAAEAAEMGATEGVPPGRHPPRLRRRLLHRRHPGRHRGRARDARARLHRPRGDRGRPPTRGAARRLPAPADGRRASLAPGHRGRDPRRRGPRRAVPRQGQHRRVVGGPPHRPLGRAEVQRDDDVRLGRGADPPGPPLRAHPGPPA